MHIIILKHSGKERIDKCQVGNKDGYSKDKKSIIGVLGQFYKTLKTIFLNILNLIKNVELTNNRFKIQMQII